MKVYNNLHGSSTYGSDWLPLSTDGFVVTMTAADCDWPFLKDSGIVKYRFKNVINVNKKHLEQNMIQYMNSNFGKKYLIWTFRKDNH
jgi:hypothetical protein